MEIPLPTPAERKAAAKEAIQQTLRDMAHNATDVRGAVRAYPWVSVGAAAAGGFLLTSSPVKRRAFFRSLKGGTSTAMRYAKPFLAGPLAFTLQELKKRVMQRA